MPACGISQPSATLAGDQRVGLQPPARSRRVHRGRAHWRRHPLLASVGGSPRFCPWRTAMSRPRACSSRTPTAGSRSSTSRSPTWSPRSSRSRDGLASYRMSREVRVCARRMLTPRHASPRLAKQLARPTPGLDLLAWRAVASRGAASRESRLRACCAVGAQLAASL